VSEQTPPEGQAPAPHSGDGEPAPAAGDSVTEGGYDYTVVGDEGGAGERGKQPGGRVPWPAVVAAAVVPAVVVGVAVWFFAHGGGGDKHRVAANVTNVINAFSQGRSGTVSTRYEGELAPGFPAAIPSYPGAKLVSSELQISGDDADYLAVYDTLDGRQKVAAFFGDKLNADPWQVDAAQDGRDSSLRQFSNVSDANVRGLVLAAESKQDDLTTVIVSVQVTSGAKSLVKPTYTPGQSKALPDGFPQTLPVYPDATVIDAAFQKSSNTHSFAVSLVTRDSVAKVIDYYRAQLQSGGLTVKDGDASQSTLTGATAVEFSDSGQTLGGQIIAGQLAEDANFTRIDINASTQK